MGCKTQFCIGGACEPTSTNVQAWVTAFGYAYDPNDPLQEYYNEVIASYPESRGNPVWAALCEACMRVRGLLFCNTNPGDVTGIKAGAQPNLLGLSSGAALQGAQIGEAAAGVAANSAVGLVTAGVGVALGIVLQIFQAHARAVSLQENALDQLTPMATQAIRNSDASVASGQSTAAQGVAFLRQLSTQFSQLDAALTKQCNAFCGFNAIISAIADVSVYYYQASGLASTLASGVSMAASAIASTASNVIGAAAGAIGVSPSPATGFSLASIPSIVWVIVLVLLVVAVSRGG